MNGFQPFPVDMRVNLSRRYIRMPEHFLHGTQIGPMFEQMRRKRMPEGVRRDLPLDVRFTGITLNNLPHALTADFFSQAAEKDKSGCLIFYQLQSGQVIISLNSVTGPAADRNNPLFPSLPDTTDIS